MFAHAEHRSDWVSYEDFLANAEGVRAEWVDGEILYMSPQTDRHLLISGFLYKALGGYVRLKGIGGRVMQAGFQVRLGPRVGREPDVSYVAPQNMHRLTRTFVEGPVDLAVEVISPDSRVRDRRDKHREYAQYGVREYWLIDPDKETIEVFHLGAGGEVYEPVALGTPARVTSDVIPGLWIDPVWMWADDPDEFAAYREWGLI
ncbi:Uma2 family endonuclease [Longimicrobium terrae]|uniref:Uma2 family endonuclease n=1 Tax=Longimicrobium terrae TaxID=1639882 RepID=A0A841H666_9BACT|nr:Uma2 family endonuclease [Longimicrobium terrae]MBB4639352.1 Uma2 family endonuclease [Longimicrobium terrae]MBB6073577.1 Uma2 family endonuclease [Longimicrobium terrae]NNC29415.1 Uma2 family endonuclease [Longimicrobium terrae]